MDIRFKIEALQRQWTPPRGLDRARPREVCLTGAGKALVVLAGALMIAALAVGILLEVAARAQAEKRRVWDEQAVSTQGRVTRLWQRRQGENPRLWMAYEFSANRRTYGGNARISRPLWNSLEVGAAVPVRYIPSRPDVNHPFSQSPDTMPRFLPYVIALVLGGLCWLCCFFVRRERRLLAEGRPAVAIIIGHSRMHRSSHGGEVGKVAYYQFAQLSGALAKGETGPRKEPPAIGSTIPILYDPENPGRNSPYPFSLVRPR